MNQRRPITSTLLAAVAVTMLGTLVAVPASAAPASRAPVSPAAVTTVAVPVSCTFGPDTPVFDTTAHVTVSSPANALLLQNYSAKFTVHIDDLVAPFDVQSITVTSNFTISGPVHPKGAVTFTTAPQALATGQEPTDTTFAKAQQAGLQSGTVGYRFDGLSYDFKFAGSSTIHAACTLTNGPVVVRTTKVIGLL